MYQNFSPYEHDPYEYEYRPVEGLVGQFFTLQIPLTVPTGEVLPPGTRIFIHRVNFTQVGIELVTIVYPSGFGGNCIANSAQVSANQLGFGPPGVMGGSMGGTPIGGFQPPRPPRPPR